jgi:hypothetical protein
MGQKMYTVKRDQPGEKYRAATVNHDPEIDDPGYEFVVDLFTINPLGSRGPHYEPTIECDTECDDLFHTTRAAAMVVVARWLGAGYVQESAYT